MHMVNKFKVAGKHWRECRSFNSLLEYEDLEHVYLIYIKSINSWNDGLGRVIYMKYNLNYMFFVNLFLSFVWWVLVDTIFT